MSNFSIFTPANSVSEFHLLPIFVNTWCWQSFILAIFVSVGQYLMVVLTSISLITNEIEYFFICLQAIGMLSFVKCLYKFCAIFILSCLIWSFVGSQFEPGANEGSWSTGILCSWLQSKTYNLLIRQKCRKINILFWILKILI